MVRSFAVTDPRTRSAVTVAFTALAGAAALAGVVWWLRDVRMAVLVVAGLVFLVAGAWRVALLPFLYLAFTMLLPREGNASQFEIFPIYYHEMTFIPVFAAMLILLFAGITLDPNRDSLRAKRVRFDVQGLLITLFLAWAAFSYLRGLAIGNSYRYMMTEISYVAMFASYFFWREYFRWRGGMRGWLWVVLALAVATAIEFVWLFALNFTDVVSFVTGRMLTRQSQVPIAAMPLAVAFFLIKRGAWWRAFAALLILLISAHVFITQQRSLWVAVVGMALLFFTLYVFRRGFTLRRLLAWFTLLVVTGGFFAGVLYAASWLLGADISFLLTRWEDVKTLRDESFLIRIYDLRNAVDAVGGQWFWGLGGGRLHPWVHSGWAFYYFDISYGIAFFKGGVPWALLLVVVYLTGILRAFKLYLRRSDPATQVLAIAIICALSGEFVAGLFSTSLIFYRFVFLWMLLAAATTVFLEQTAEPARLPEPEEGRSR